MNRNSCSLNLTALKKCLLWRSRFSWKCSSSEKVATYAKRGIIIWKEIDYLCVILSYCLNICFLSQYFFLGNCFAKSAFNSTNLFQGLPQGLQLNGSYLGSSLGFSVIGSSLSFLGPRYASPSLKIYFLKFDIFSWGIQDVAEKMCPLF